MSKFDDVYNRLTEEMPNLGLNVANTGTTNPAASGGGFAQAGAGAQTNNPNLDQIAQAIAQSKDVNEIKALIQPLFRS
jgi:hypothetical protein